MKKLLALLLAMAMVFSLAACTSSEPAPAPDGGEEAAEEDVVYPENGVLTINVAYSAGGTTDVVARQLGAMMGEYLGCDVNVQNVTGGSASVAGIKTFSENTGDGSQVFAAVPSMASSWQVTGMTNDIDWEDFYYFYMCSGPYIMLVKADSPFNTLDDIIAYGKANPGKLTAGNSGIGSLVHLSGSILYKNLGIEVTHVPYGGGRETCTKVMAGECDLFWGALPDVTDYIKSGDVKPIVISSVESGTVEGPNGDIEVPGVGKDYPAVSDAIAALSTWGMMMPRETEDKYVLKFAEAFEACATDPEFIDFCDNLGASAMCMYGQEADIAILQAQSILSWGLYDMGIAADGVVPDQFGIQKPDSYKLDETELAVAKPFPSK